MSGLEERTTMMKKKGERLGQHRQHRHLHIVHIVHRQVHITRVGRHSVDSVVVDQEVVVAQEVGKK